MRGLRISVQVEKTAQGSVWAHALVDFHYERATRVGIDTLDFIGVCAADAWFLAWAAAPAPDEGGDRRHAFLVMPVWAHDVRPLAERPLLPGAWFLAGRGATRGPSPLWRERGSDRPSLRIVACDCQVAYDPMPWRSDDHSTVDAIRGQQAPGLPWRGPGQRALDDILHAEDQRALAGLALAGEVGED